jgi:hypothetical protein
VQSRAVPIVREDHLGRLRQARRPRNGRRSQSRPMPGSPPGGGREALGVGEAIRSPVSAGTQRASRKDRLHRRMPGATLTARLAYRRSTHLHHNSQCSVGLSWLWLLSPTCRAPARRQRPARQTPAGPPEPRQPWSATPSRLRRARQGSGPQPPATHSRSQHQRAATDKDVENETRAETDETNDK